MRGKVVLTVAGLVLAAATARADDKLQTLLREVAPAAGAPKGSVAVSGWLERSATGPELVVRLVPEGAAKLVGDPGLTVTPLPSSAEPTPPGDPVTLVDSTHNYLTEPPTVRVPLPRHAGGPVAAQVDYAYCITNYICLFGEAKLDVADASKACGAASAVAC